MNKSHWIALLVAIVLIGFWVWNGIDSKPASDEPIKIGVSTILSGDFAALGENIVNTAILTVEEINKDGGINGRPLELAVEDAGLDSKTGLSATQKLVNVDGVKYIIGGTTSNGTLASAPLVNEQKVLYLTPVTGGSNVDNGGEYIFRIANADILAGVNLADAVVNLGFTKVASISEVTEYTTDIQKSFEVRIKELGGEVVLSDSFTPGETDFRTTLSKVKSANPEAILILSQTGVSAAHFMKQAGELGINGPFFSDFTLPANTAAEEVLGSFEGLYFADPAYSANSDDTEKFFDSYEKKFGNEPFISFHSASAHDGIVMLASAMREVGDDSEKVHDWLLDNVQNWTGLMGTYSLDKDGNSDLGFVVKQIKNGEAVELK